MIYLRAIIKYMLCLGFAIVFLASCRTTRDLPTVTARPMSTSKLLKSIEQNAFDYDYFTIKRINCNFADNQSKATFKINLKAKKDGNNAILKK